jgi:hypothetical protein
MIILHITPSKKVDQHKVALGTGDGSIILLDCEAMINKKEPKLKQVGAGKQTLSAIAFNGNLLLSGSWSGYH